MITARMKDAEEARRMQTMLVEEIQLLQLAIDMDQPDVTIRQFRQDALDALVEVEMAADQSRGG